MKQSKNFSKGHFFPRGDDCDKLFGLAVCSEVTNDFKESLRLLNNLIMRFPAFLPALVEKIDVLLCAGQWEQALDAAARYQSLTK